MWSKKLRKIIDISVACAAGVTLLAVAGTKVLSSRNDYKKYAEEYDAKINSYKDEFGHIPVEIKRKDPTETEDGNTDGKQCMLCGEYYDGYQVLPKLNPYDYDRTTAKDTGGKNLIITWTLKESYATEHGITGGFETKTMHSLSTNFGFINVNNETILCYEFGLVHPGIEMSFDSASNLLTWNVTKQGGVTIEDEYFKSPTEGTSLKITGEPLTIINKAENDCISLNKGTLFIENSTTICVHEHVNTVTGKSAITTKNMNIAEGASLHVSNYQYGMYFDSGSTSIVYGTLNVSGSTSIANNVSNRKLDVGENNAIYVKEVQKQVGGTYNLVSGTKHLTVCNKDANINDNIYYNISKITKPTTEAGGHVWYACADCEETKFEVDIPALTDPGYATSKTPISVDNTIKDVTCYVYNVPNHPTAEQVVVDERADNGFIVANKKLYSPSFWTTKFPKAVASQSGEGKDLVLTITLSGDQTVGSSSEFDGPISFSGYKKVIIAGSGTLTFDFEADMDVLELDDFEIQSGAKVKVVGTSHKTSSAITLNKSLTINGGLEISNFLYGISAANPEQVEENIIIGSTGTLDIKTTSIGIHNTTPIKLTSEGTFKFDNTSVGSNNVSNRSAILFEEASDLNFKGSSLTEIKSNYYGFVALWDIGYNNVANHPMRFTAKSPRVRVQGNSTFNVESTKDCLHYINRFIVENENGTKCDAIINLKTSGTDTYGISMPRNVNTDKTDSVKHYLVFNSSVRANITCTAAGATLGKGGILIKGGLNLIRFDTAVKFTHFSSAIVTNSISLDSSEITYNNASPMIVVDGSDVNVVKVDAGSDALATLITAKTIEA